MKNILIAGILITTLLYVTACSSTQTVSHLDSQKEIPGFSTSITDKGQGWGVHAEKQNFKLLFNQDDLAYYYYIFNQQHTVAEEGGFSFHGKELILEQISEDIVKMSSWTGVGPGTAWSRYYNEARDLFSPVLWDVFDEYGNLVVYQSTHKTIVVQDAFDEQVFSKEFATFTQPLADSPAPFLGAKFIDDGKSIEVTYLTANEDLPEFTETIDLSR